jgi:trehalose synthase
MTNERRQLREVTVAPESMDRFVDLLDTGQAEELRKTAARARDLLSGRVVWNVNSTASGGGVAEMLQSLVGYGRGAGVDTRWLVLDGDPAFFTVTKRVHNFLHGASGDGGDLGRQERSDYSSLLEAHHEDLLGRVRPGDIAVLHDPQTAGLVEVLAAAGVHTVWRCHIGADIATVRSEEAWEFLRPFVASAERVVFSRAAYVPSWVPLQRCSVIAPSIDPLSVKNRALPNSLVESVLAVVGLTARPAPSEPVTVLGHDSAPFALRARTGLRVGDLPAPPEAAPLVVQVSRWDTLKDMVGVMTAFTEFVAAEHPTAHLMLVGPAVEGVGDDPEGAAVLAQCTDSWRQLPDPLRRRVHLARIPMDDVDENAIIVNAIQRHASVIVQKSLAEGFGLTVTEAMWKARPVVASAVGGIPDQVDSGVNGLLVPPHDLLACGHAIDSVLADPAGAEALGAAAKESVRRGYLGDRHLRQWVECFASILSAAGQA